uniref:Matrix metalloproteinase-14-like n=1 Tax=Hirondellea gigas TaxID=1518452 RepID=A0A2P2I1R8_9CRUS
MEMRSLWLHVAVLVSSTLLTEVMPQPITPVVITGTTTALMYLSRYGYMDPAATNPENGALLSLEAVRSAIIEFQAFAGLNQTGELDAETREMMNRRRCGNKDIIGHGANTRRKKRYALQGSRWRVRNLSYKVTKYPSGLTRAAVDKEIAIAFNAWEEVSDLTFKPATTGKVHIDIRFARGEHGDGDPFDGRGGTLAHAYFPIYGGDAHFDDAEHWTIESYRGTNLLQVAAHEFGHSLGLSHSDVHASLMAPFYRGYERKFDLHNDDIVAIQKLYGKPKRVPPFGPSRPTTTTTAVPGTPISPSSELCRDSSIDAMVTMADKYTYVFKGSRYWRLTDEATAPGYPKQIALYWDGLPSNLDAAFTWVNGKTYFFKGSNYWRFSNMSLDSDYPKHISKGFAGIPNSVDAAFVWSGNGKIYFFKDDKYYRFDPTKRPPVKENYPKEVSNWEGIPNNIDDALQYSNGFTYFFKNGRYWRFNDRAFRVDSADPPFPRPVGYWWFGCQASGSQVLQTSRANEVIPSDDYDVQGDVFDADDSSQENRLLSIDGASPRFGTGPSRDQPHQQHHHYQQSHPQQHYGVQDPPSGAEAVITTGFSHSLRILSALMLPVFVSMFAA